MIYTPAHFFTDVQKQCGTDHEFHSRYNVHKKPTAVLD
jgi:hypothetical protein